MTAIEHRELKGITLKNLIVTIVSTASIVASVMTTYFGLKNDIRDIRSAQQTEARIYEIRLKVLEGQVALLQKRIDEIEPADVEDRHAETVPPSPKNTWPILTSTQK